MSEEEKEALKEFCDKIKSTLDGQKRPFILAIGGIPGQLDSTQGILVSGTMTQVECLVIETLRVITEKGVEAWKN